MRPPDSVVFVGLFLGLVVGFVRDRSDKRLRGRQDLAERLDRPVLASIPALSRYKRRDHGFGWASRERSSLVTIDQPNSPAAVPCATSARPWPLR